MAHLPVFVLATPSEAADAEQRNPASRLHVLPRDMFEHYLARRYLAGHHIPGATHAGARGTLFRAVREIIPLRCHGLCVLPDGDLCVADIADATSGTVRWVARDSDERRSTEIAVPGSATVCLTRSGRLAVALLGADCVRIYTLRGELVATFGSRGRRDGELICPSGIALDRDGHLVVCDMYNNRLQVFTEAGEFVRTVGTPPEPNPRLRTVDYDRTAAVGCLDTPCAVAVHPGTGHYYVVE